MRGEIITGRFVRRGTVSRIEKRILLIEDDVSIAVHLLKVIDGIVGVRCKSTSSGAAAIEIASRHDPDLAIVDIELGGQPNGVETAMVLRNSLHVPTIFLSSTTNPKIIERARLANPVDVIWAPYPREHVVNAVARLFNERKTAVGGAP